MKSIMRIYILCLLACLVLLAPSGLAQQYRATLTGIVTDAQGAVVPGAKIQAIHAETSAKFNAEASAEGNYTMPFLTPGMYVVTVETPGFKKYVQENVTLNANQHVTLDIRLEVGSISDSVTVSADATMLTTTSASMGQPITTKSVESVPMSGRAALALTVLSFGVTNSGAPTSNTRPFDNQGSANFAMGGSATLTNEILLDGGPSMSQNRRAGYNPPLDAVAEVKVEVFQSDAAYGDTAGGTVNIITKGGTNLFHGSTDWYNENAATAAVPFFTNAAGQKNPVTLWNQWGVTASGPIFVPKVYNGKDRLFWYFGYEGIRHYLPQAYTLTVPTGAERTGNFSETLKYANGSGYQLYDPSTGVVQGTRRVRQPFPNNIIPASRINQIALNYLQYYPQPNQAGSNGVGNFLANTVRRDRYFDTLGRLDYVTEKNKFFWNAHWTARTERIYQYFGNIAQGAINPRDTEGSQWDDVWTINSTTLLNSRLSWNRFTELTEVQSMHWNSSPLGFPGYMFSTSQYPVMPGISFTDSFNSLGACCSGTGYINPWDTWQYFEALNKVKGKHSLKMGLDLRKLRESKTDFGYSSGLFSFGTTGGQGWVNGPNDNSAAAPLGGGMASFLLGLPVSGQYDMNGSRTNVSWYGAVFLQDDWRVRPNLTLNLGLRYEKETGAAERYYRALGGFDFSSANGITQAAKAAYASNPIAQLPAAAFNPVGGPLFTSASQPNIYSTYNKSFSPRFGFAWTPAALGAKWVFRGGIGIFYDPRNDSGVYQPGFSLSNQFVATSDGFLTPAATLNNPFPNGILSPPGSKNGLNTNIGQSVTYYNPSPAAVYTERWTFNIQHELANNLILEMGYIGSHGLHLPVSVNRDYVPRQFLSPSLARDNTVNNALTANVANPFQGLLPNTNLNGSTIAVSQLLMPYPQLTGLSEDSDTAGSSIYHAAAVRIEKRFSHGLQFLTSITRSKLEEIRSRLNPSDPYFEKRVGTDDRPWRFVESGTYELPFGKGKVLLSSPPAWANRIVGGWNVAGIFTLQSGTPLSWGNVIYYGGPLNLNPRNLSQAFDTTQFNTISSQQLVNNIRYFGTQFGNLSSDRTNNFDANLVKNTKIKERLNLQIRFEAFNAFNHTQFSGPTLSPTSGNFGKITSQTNSPRVIQTAIRFVW